MEDEWFAIRDNHRNANGRINRKIEASRLNVRAAELDVTREQRPGGSFGIPLFAVVVLGAGGLFGFSWWLGHHGRDEHGNLRLGGISKPVRVLRTASVFAAIALLLAAWLHAPWHDRVMTEERLQEVRAQAAERIFFVDPLDGTREFVAKNGEGL